MYYFFRFIIKLCLYIFILVLACNRAEAVSYNDLPLDFRKKWEALLHYKQGRSLITNSDNYFLDPYGYIDPAGELLETINFFQNTPEGWCVFPARYYLIYGSLPLNNNCNDFKEYTDYVNVEKLSVVFASEDETSPISSMGHVLMMIDGKDINGIRKKHSFGFVADNSSSLFFDFVTDSIEGRYILSPYSNVIYKYVSEEHRSLWEYSLNLTREERFLVFLHMFELKNHKIKYSYFSYNCASGLNQVLGVASSSLKYEDYDLFVTPVEYIKYLRNTGKIDGITVRPSKKDYYYLNDKYAVDPLSAPPLSRFSVLYRYNNKERNGLHFNFLPLYSDISEDIWYTSKTNEIQFLSVSGNINSSHSYVSELKIFDLKSLPDIRSDSPNVNLGLSLHGNIDSSHTQLYPDFRIGTGISCFSYGFVPFLQVTSGLHLEHHGPNLYMIENVGFMLKTMDWGRLTFFNKYIHASHGRYSGYNNETSLVYSKNIAKNYWVQMNASYYYKKNNSDFYDISVGIGFRF